MASRTRYLLCFGGAYYSGSKVRKLLVSANPLPGIYASLESQEEMIKCAEKVGAKLWIFREPRRIRTAKSRYRGICAKLGIGKRKMKPPPVNYAQQTIGQAQAAVAFAQQVGQLQYNLQYNLPHHIGQPPAIEEPFDV